MRRLRRGFVLIALLMPAVPHAGTLTVSPVRVTLDANGRSDIVRLHNPGATSSLIQIEAVAWSEDVDRAPRVDEILAVPPIFELGANGQQVIRLALRQPHTGPTEQAYRLLITEVPRGTGASNALVFAIRLNLPVFVTPPGAAPEPVWALRSTPAGAAELVLTNQGRAHVRIEKLELRADEGSLSVSEEVTYVLARQKRAWPLDQPLSALPHSLEVRAETNRGPLVAPVARAGP